MLLVNLLYDLSQIPVINSILVEELTETKSVAYFDLVSLSNVLNELGNKSCF